MENKKFHLTVTNNETGETLCDINTGVIIGAADGGEGTHSFSFVAGEIFKIVATIVGVKKILDTLYDDHPKLKAAEILHAVFNEEHEETAETAEN